MLVGEIVIYLALILTALTAVTKLFFVLLKKEFKIYTLLLKIGLSAFLAGAVILGAGRIFGF